MIQAVTQTLNVVVLRGYWVGAYIPAYAKLVQQTILVYDQVDHLYALQEL